ncbi:MAG: GNAT family protein [Gammaproteobacteria bacterium]|nr:GNAT family protein [Gammaproteobacteria bacterium]
MKGKFLQLRVVQSSDCTEEYLSWLENPTINQYLETRWEKQNLSRIRSFVKTMEESGNNILFAIIEKSSKKHIGNIKLGPINYNHQYADISYFIGDSKKWGKGYATEAIELVTHYAFNDLDLENVLAGVYESNVGSQRVLEKVGYIFQGKFIKQLLNVSGDREDHYWYSISRSEFKL